MGGGNSIVIGVFIGLDIFGPWRLAPFFLTRTRVFLDVTQGTGNLDIETRCIQEIIDAGKIRILKDQKYQKCKKWWRG
jgi:hypothetical protein